METDIDKANKIIKDLAATVYVRDGEIAKLEAQLGIVHEVSMANTKDRRRT